MIKYSTQTGYDVELYRDLYLKEYNNDYKRLLELDRQFANCNEDIAYYTQYLEEENEYNRKKAEFKWCSIIDGAIAGIGVAILAGICIVAPEFKIFGGMIAGACVTPTALLQLYETITYALQKSNHNFNQRIYDMEDEMDYKIAKETIVEIKEIAKNLIRRMGITEEHINYLEEYRKIYSDILKNNAHITGMSREMPTQEKKELSVPSFVLKSDPFELMPVSIIKRQQKTLGLVNSLED